VFQRLRATAPQTYYRFRTSNGTAHVLYVLLRFLTPSGFYSTFYLRAAKSAWRIKWSRTLRLIHGRKSWGEKKNVKTTADERQLLSRVIKKAYTWSKSKMIFLEVNFCEKQIDPNPLGFHVFFEDWIKSQKSVIRETRYF